MPLHLLGKKSWNVYNTDNIERVRRDEAIAKTAEEAEEQRMQEIDAQRRLAILRGENPPPLVPVESPQLQDTPYHRSGHSSGGRKKRKRAGEDDTEFQLRLANERNEPQPNNLETSRKPTSSAPIVDHAGHIDLFGDERARAHAEKNEEAQKESNKKKREYEDQYTMRFSNAAGKSGLNSAWYSKSELATASIPTKDVWGNDDPKRRDRDTQRIIANDPLAVMKKSASKVREINKERKRLQEERDEELRQLRKEQRRKEKHSRRSNSRPGERSPRETDRRRRSRDGRTDM